MGDPDPSREHPLLSEYLKHLSLERGLSPNTCKSYESDLRAYFADLAGKDPLQATPDSLTRYIWKLRSERKLKPNSVFRAMEALRSFYRFQLGEERIAEEPTRNFQSP